MTPVQIPRNLGDPVALLDFCNAIDLKVPDEVRALAASAPKKLAAAGIGWSVEEVDAALTKCGMTVHQRLHIKTALSHAGLLLAGRRIA
jgi:hypothetical protein